MKRKPKKRLPDPVGETIDRMADLQFQFIQLLDTFETLREKHRAFLESPECEELWRLLSIQAELTAAHAAMKYESHVQRSALLQAIENRQKDTARKGGAARSKKAEPNHKAIRKRFRELRKTTPKKTVRYLRVAEEYGMSDRHVARIVDGID